MYKFYGGVTLEGKGHQQILNTRSMGGGEPLPETQPKSLSIPTLVIFSVGTSEEIE